MNCPNCGKENLEPHQIGHANLYEATCWRCGYAARESSKEKLIAKISTDQADRIMKEQESPGISKLINSESERKIMKSKKETEARITKAYGRPANAVIAEAVAEGYPAVLEVGKKAGLTNPYMWAKAHIKTAGKEAQKAPMSKAEIFKAKKIISEKSLISPEERLRRAVGDLSLNDIENLPDGLKEPTISQYKYFLDLVA